MKPEVLVTTASQREGAREETTKRKRKQEARKKRKKQKHADDVRAENDRGQRHVDNVPHAQIVGHFAQSPLGQRKRGDRPCNGKE